MAAKRPAALELLAAALAELPGIGPVSSERLAYHLLEVPKHEALALAHAIQRAREEICVCSLCANLDQSDPCWVCADTTREQGTILVVESPRELLAFEASGYRGLYHVLQGRIAPLEEIGESDLTIASLVKRVQGQSGLEVCIATDPDLEGEASAELIRERLAGSGVKVTRIARGVPAGATIAQVQHTILSDAFEGRRPLD
ncbi:MAG: recombination protein RecR [Planctomycetota bacterium]|nr:MAG: recombination protein RecR [Planctomycetota bacterium]